MNTEKMPWESKKWSIAVIAIVAIVIVFGIVAALAAADDLPMLGNVAIGGIVGIVASAITTQGINDQKKLGG